jgi:Uma2 family endonuclease
MSQEVEMTATMAETPAALVLTAEEYDALPANPRAELVDGVLRPMTPPAVRHQRIVSRLERELERRCPDELLTVREQDVYLDDLNRRNPDVLVVRAAAVDLDGNTYRPADVVLAAEVVSPTSRTVDRKYKLIEYAECGIAHYWVVEPLPELTVLTYLVDGQAYRRTGEFVSGQTIDVPGLPWATVPVDALRPDL